jgi:hypothetical protein
VKKAFPIALVLVGLVLVGAGIYTMTEGLDAKDQVRAELIAQNIATPEDASIPNARVDDAATAQAMASIIDVHAREATEGRTYAEIGRYLSVDGGDTNDESEAMVGADGRPIANPVRNVAFQASTLQTSLYTSVMAFKVSDLVTGLGILIVVMGLAVSGIGVAFAGLVIPTLARRVRVEPVAVQPAVEPA